jgi:hypothetical protein
MLPEMIKHLKETTHGYPGHSEADTPEKWDTILDEIVLSFEAANRVCNDEYYTETNSDILDRKPTKKEIHQWRVKSRKDQRIFHKGMKLFDKWFFNLWD